MGQINVLDISVANLIAAGEVVERPAAAIKELVENSIDAGARNITVEIQKGGIALFRVTDDGCGMSGEDAILSVKRHATSKIKTAKDLNQILTLGFRGEALAAISAVTKFRMLTKKKDDPSGTSLSMEYGSAPKVAEVGCPNGTTIICEGLFATTPARLKFLKSDMSELREVQSSIEKEAVSHPDISFKFIADGSMRFSSNGNGKLSDAIYSVYGREFANSLTPVSSSSGGITVNGFVSAPTFARGNRSMQIFFVNGRPVRSKIMSAALDQAGETYIPVGRYPACVLNITIHSAYVDVNIHPSKLEVKFSDEKSIFSAVYYSVRSAYETRLQRPTLVDNKPSISTQLNNAKITEAFAPVKERGEKISEQLSIDTVIKPVEIKIEIPKEIEKPLSINVTTPKQASNETSEKEVVIDYKPSTSKASNQSKSHDMPTYQGLSVDADDMVYENKNILEEKLEVKTNTINTDAQIPNKIANEIPNYKIAGEVFDSYIIVEYEDKMLLIDKHAAHERINFEKLRVGMTNLTPNTQLLLSGLKLDLMDSEIDMVNQYKNELTDVGFTFEINDKCVTITGMPIDYNFTSGRELFEKMISELLENGTPIEIQKRTVFEKALYQTSCKMSIKAGRHYDDETIKWICDNIFRYDCIKYCPHGRPVAYEIKKRDLDTRFGRIK
ncbi:MAG: DNA mismatch repair endonuclease MutL [Clostridia bacterium]|nr:DNA mismatch repair endonuclease MutL [Clostridia bacterium]